MTYLLVFVFGAMIGSFLNVCIYRIPRNQSIIFPRSRCSSCRKYIRWYDNIPLLSYILLKGKCRFCNRKIPFRYFIVEFITGLSFLMLYMNFGFTHKFWIYGILTSGLIVASFIDLDLQIIPDSVSLGGLGLGFLLSIFIPGLHNQLTWQKGFIDSILGALVGAGLIYSVINLGNLGLFLVRQVAISLKRHSYWRKKLKRYRHIKESMGFGDLKLMGMLGAFLGWKMILIVFLLAPFLGFPVGLYLRLKKNIDFIPYGPYIALASFIVMMWGNRILYLLYF